MVTNRGLARSYSRLAPFYDAVAGGFTSSRRRSLSTLDLKPGERVLLSGVGTGLDLPLLPSGLSVYALDLTPAMLAKARTRSTATRFQCGDACALPFQDDAFDAVILHLVLAIVPDPARALAEAARVTRPGGRLAVFDKFLAAGKRAGPVRSALDRLLRPLVTGLNTRFADLHRACPNLKLVSDSPDLFGGQFRRILLHKTPCSPRA